MSTAAPDVFPHTDATPPGEHDRLVNYLAATTLRASGYMLEEAAMQPGWRCLDVGAGDGRIAEDMAETVAPRGEVIATELNPSWSLLRRAGVTVLQHDIAHDCLPGTFNLIRASMVLGEVADRDAVVVKLVNGLRPGGALLIEEFDERWDECVLDSPTPEADRLFATYQLALMRVLTDAGADPTFGRLCHRAMRTAGLLHVWAQFASVTWHGGEAGCLFARSSAEQLREPLIAAGMAARDLEAFGELLRDERLVIRGNALVSTIGWKPRPPLDDGIGWKPRPPLDDGDEPEATAAAATTVST